MATYSLKLSTENCSQTAADGDMVSIDSVWEIDTVLSAGTIDDPLWLTVHPQYRIIGSVCYYSSRSSKVNDLYFIWKPLWDFLLVINSNLGPILHCLATTRPWQTEDGLMSIARHLLKFDRLKRRVKQQRLQKRQEFNSQCWYLLMKMVMRWITI